MEDVYKLDSHKLIYHPHETSKWLKGEDVYPIYAEVSPVGFCNHECSFCALDFDHHNRSLDTSKFTECVKDMADNGVKSIMFAGEGEPLLHKELSEMIIICNYLGIDTALTTNLSIDKHLEVAKKHCKWIKVSINGGNRDSYKEVHGKDDFDKVVNNIKKLKGCSGNATVGLQCVELPENSDYIENLVTLVDKLDLDYLVVKPFSQHKKSISRKYEGIEYKLHNYKHPKVIWRANTAEKWNNQKKDYDKCYSAGYFHAYIESSGDVYACSCMLGDDKFNLGNINLQTFSEIWEGRKRKELIEHMSDFDMSKCRINCRADFINEYLWKLKNPGAHSNFI